MTRKILIVLRKVWGKSSTCERKDGGGLVLKNLKLPREKKSVLKESGYGNVKL